MTADVQIPLNPASGRQAITLTGWTGSALFATTPVATDQIEGPDTLTYSTDSDPTGADGTYILRHIIAATGQVEAVSFQIGAGADVVAPILSLPGGTALSQTEIDASVTTDENNGSVYVLVSINASETTQTILTNGVSQAVSATGEQIISVVGLDPDTAYYLHFLHVDAAGNQSDAVVSSQVTTDAIVLTVAETTVPLVMGAAYTVATLKTGFYPYMFQQWPVNEPAVGWQLVTLTANGYYDSQGNFWRYPGGADGVYPVWVIDLDGVVHYQTVDTTGLQNPLSGEMAFGTPIISRNSASLPFTYSAADAEGYQYRVDGGEWINVVSPISLTGLDAATSYTVDLRAYSGTTQSVFTTIEFTTDAAVDAVPRAFVLTAQTNVAKESLRTSNVITILDVDAGVDIPISVSGDTGSKYSVSTDGGVTWGGQTSASTTVRLNYKVRVHHPASPEYSSGPYDGVRETILNIGGVVGTFRSTTVADTTPPAITLVGGNVTIVQGEPWIDPGYSAVDDADGAIPVGNFVLSGTVNPANVGEQPVTYSVSDLSGNSASATRIVTVVEFVPADNTRPVIALFGGNQEINLGEIWVDPGFEATDNVDGVITDRVDVTGVVNGSVAGQYTITYTVMDLAGNIRTATRIVTVKADVSLTVLAPVYRTVIPADTSQVFFKAPQELLDFDIELTDWVAGETDSITAGLEALSVVTSDPGLQVSASSYIGTEDRIKVWLAGGIEGEDYLVSAFVTTTAGRRKKFLFRIVARTEW